MMQMSELQSRAFDTCDMYMRFCIIFSKEDSYMSLVRSQSSPGLRCGSAAARLLGLWVWTLPAAWMSVCCKYFVLSGRALCDGLITHPKDFDGICCVEECVIVKPRKWGGLGQKRALAPWKNVSIVKMLQLSEIYSRACKTQDKQMSLFVCKISKEDRRKFDSSFLIF